MPFSPSFPFLNPSILCGFGNLVQGQTNLLHYCSALPAREMCLHMKPFMFFARVRAFHMDLALGDPGLGALSIMIQKTTIWL